MVSTVPHIINVCLLSVYYSVLKVISLPTTAASVAIRENIARALSGVARVHQFDLLRPLFSEQRKRSREPSESVTEREDNGHTQHPVHYGVYRVIGDA